MKKIVLVVFLVFLSVALILLGIFFHDYKLVIDKIELVKTDFNNNTFEISIIKKKGLLFNHTFSCKASNGDNEITDIGKNNECHLIIPMNDNYKVQLKNRVKETKMIDLKNSIDNKHNFRFDKERVYLRVGEEYNLNYALASLIKDESTLNFVSDNADIVSVNGDILVGKSVGSTNITLEGANTALNVVVTDLVTMPTYIVKKQNVPCNKYSVEENEILDNLLKERVDQAGRKTRAGAVAAARFLTLEFPYRIPYFYENGRLGEDGSHYVDGEGRYYHEGLYLNESKMENITLTYSGPAIWGCPLTNWEDEPYFGFTVGKLMPNGLDCSGFVAWTLVNGGFDPGDIGAGENEGIYQMTDLGEFTPLDMDVMNSGVIKVGDLFNYWGHIAIIIGWDGEHYYVAESLPNFGGVDVRVYTPQEAVHMFKFVVLMDKYYQEDGNYTEFWN